MAPNLLKICLTRVMLSSLELEWPLWLLQSLEHQEMRMCQSLGSGLKSLAVPPSCPTHPEPAANIRSQATLRKPTLATRKGLMERGQGLTDPWWVEPILVQILDR